MGPSSVLGFAGAQAWFGLVLASSGTAARVPADAPG